MGSIVNGLTLHGGLRGYGATFLTFSDYMRPAVRLGALMGAPSIWVWTHDSIFLGEDGPTHQAVEHLAALRSIPNLWVLRPGTPAEVTAAWQMALDRTNGPTALVFTRQGIPIPDDDVDVDVAARGAYIATDGTDVTIVATGSELWVAKEAASLLGADGISARVVSMPCREAFVEQPAAYRADIMGEQPVVTLEAAATFGWGDIASDAAGAIGLDGYGESAPWQALAEHFGFTPEAVAQRVGAWLDSR